MRCKSDSGARGIPDSERTPLSRGKQTAGSGSLFHRLTLLISVPFRSRQRLGAAVPSRRSGTGVGDGSRAAEPLSESVSAPTPIAEFGSGASEEPRRQ